MLHNPGVEELIEDIRAEHRRDDFAIRQRVRANNVTSAYVRRQLGWHLDLSEKERKNIEKHAIALIADGGGAYRELVLATEASAAPWKNIEKGAEAYMVRLAKQLPVWKDFAEGVCGFGALSLARIIGETGDLSNYSHPDKLKKRMGIALVDGERQRKCSDKEKAIKHGYRPARRAILYVIGNALLRAQVRAVKNDDGAKIGESAARGPYGQIYLARKGIELAKGLTKKHAHNRAKRFMEQRLLCDLWRAWRASKVVSFK